MIWISANSHLNIVPRDNWHPLYEWSPSMCAICACPDSIFTALAVFSLAGWLLGTSCWQIGFGRDFPVTHDWDHQACGQISLWHLSCVQKLFSVSLYWLAQRSSTTHLLDLADLTLGAAIMTWPWWTLSYFRRRCVFTGRFLSGIQDKKEVTVPLFELNMVIGHPQFQFDESLALCYWNSTQIQVGYNHVSHVVTSGRGLSLDPCTPWARVQNFALPAPTISMPVSVFNTSSLLARGICWKQ